MNGLRVTSIVIVLIGSAMPVAGQEPVTAPAFSPAAIRRAAAAAAREAVLSPPALRQGPADWSSVRRLSVGTEIVLTAVNPVTGPHEVLDADDASLTVLNGDGVRASGHESDIRRWAKGDPRALAGVAQGGTITSGDLRIAPEGVFVAGRKITELRQILVRIPKADVTEIRRVRGRTEGQRGAAGAVGGVLGFIGGAIVGGIVGQKIGEMAGADPSNLGPMFFSGLGGGITGAILGHRAAAGPPVGDPLVYQALASGITWFPQAQ